MTQKQVDKILNTKIGDILSKENKEVISSKFKKIELGDKLIQAVINKVVSEGTDFVNDKIKRLFNRY